MLYNILFFIILLAGNEAQQMDVITMDTKFCGKTPQTIQADFGTNCQRLNLTVCNNAWNSFSAAFSGKDPNTVTANDYQAYFNVLPIQAGQNQTLFWSGTFKIVEEVSKPNSAGAVVVSSTNTPSGIIINDLGNVTWCGNTSGIDYANNCLCNVTTQFWYQFSAVFARAAKATTFFLGDGERVNGTFGNMSFFSQVELPNLNANTVKEVIALVVHRKGKGESCSDSSGNSSMITLHNRVTARHFHYDCYDIYGQVSEAGQTKTISDCVTNLVSNIQRGVRPSVHQVDCVPSGAAIISISSLSALFLLLILMITM